MKKFPLLISSFSIILISHFASAQETLSLTSYYPSPIGSYTSLRLVPNNSATTPCRVGAMYVNLSGNLLYCYDAGSGIGAWGWMRGAWTQLGDNIFPSDVATNPQIKVGIGTSTPDYPLTIATQFGNSSFHLYNTTQGQSSGFTAGRLLIPNEILFAAGAEVLSGGNMSPYTNRFSGLHFAGGNVTIFNADVADLSQDYDFTDPEVKIALHALYNGNVGINKWVPEYPLHVVGNSLHDGIMNIRNNTNPSTLYLHGSSPDRDSKIIFTDNSPVTTTETGMLALGVSANDNLDLYARTGDFVFTSGGADFATGTRKVTITNNGDVGIGLIPLQDLHVGGGGDIRLEDTNGGGTEVEIEFADSGAGMDDFRINASFNKLSFSKGDAPTASWTTLMTLDNNGNVGIGTSAPQKPLDVRAQGVAGRIRIGSLAPGALAPGFEILNHDNNGGSSISKIIARDGVAFTFEYVPLAGDDETEYLMAIGQNGWIKMGKHPLDTDPVYPVEFVISGVATPARVTTTGNICTSSNNCLDTISDDQLKKNIRPLSGALDQLLELRGVEFEWKDTSADPYFKPGSQVGFIAQEVEKVNSQWTATNAEGQKVLSMNGFEAVAVEAIREMNNTLTELKGKVESLEEENTILRQELDKLRNN